jgi:hypothetical protein
MRQSISKTRLICFLVIGAVFSAGFPSLILQAEPCLAAEINESQNSEKSCCGHCCSGTKETSNCCSSDVSASTHILKWFCHCKVDFPAPVVPTRKQSQRMQERQGSSYAELGSYSVPKKTTKRSLRNRNEYEASASTARYILHCCWLA